MKPLYYLLGLLLLVSVSPAQDDEITNEQLVQQLRDTMGDDLGEVLPLLKQLSERYEGQVEQEPFLFLLGLAYQDTAEVDAAINTYLSYLDNFPNGPKRDFVRLNLATAYEGKENYDAAMQAYEKVYRGDGTALFRKEAMHKLCALYIKTERADEGIPLFHEVFNLSVQDEELQAQAAAWLIQGYLKAKNSKAIRPYLRYLTGPYEAVFNPQFNVDLLKYGDEFYKEDEFEEAILLYTFVKPKDRIIQFYAQLSDKIAGQLSRISPESDRYPVIQGRLNSAQANLKAVREIRSYDVDLRWRVARVYRQMGRHWEALWAFYELYLDYPTHEQVEDFVYTALKEALETGTYHLIEEIAKIYLSHEDWTKFRDPAYIALAEVYRDTERYEEMLALIEEYMENPNSYRTAAQLLSYSGAYFLQATKYQQLLDYMQPRIERFVDREPVYETLRYWTGLAHLLLGDYRSAIGMLSGYVEDYQVGNVYYEDAYYRYSISLYGDEQFEKAEVSFTYFVTEYPDSQLRGEAELYLGDLKRDRGDLKSAAEHYRTVDTYTDSDIFIGRAAFALSEVLEEDGDPEQALEVLHAYIDTYGEYGQLGESYLRIGGILVRLERFDELFQVQIGAIKQMGDDANRYAVDKIIDKYIGDYTYFERAFKDSRALLDRMIEEADFRKEFLTNRVFQYQFMQSVEGAAVDKKLEEMLVRDRNFRASIIETEIPIDIETGLPMKMPGVDIVTAEDAVDILDKWRSFYDKKLEIITPYDPRLILDEMYQEAVSNSQQIFIYRVEYARDLLRSKLKEESDEAVAPIYSTTEMEIAPPQIIIWQAGLREDYDPEAAESLYRMVLELHPAADTANETLLALGDLLLDRAEESGEQEDWEAALACFQQANERFAFRSKDARAYLKMGQILSELGRDDDAVTTLENVLRNPQWRGMDHAVAHLELGLVYMRKEKWAEAHGWFERLIVAYGGFREIVAKAYYYDLLTLEAMEETESVQQLLEEYKTRLTILKDTEAHTMIKEKYDL